VSNRKKRDDARHIVERQKAKERRRRQTVLTTAIAVVVLVVGGFIGWGLMAGQGASEKELVTPVAAVDEGSGFSVGTGRVTVDVYEDFLCPACGAFEQQSGATLEKLAADGTVTVVYHPIAILDRYSSTEYSTRAAAASAAAAEGGKFAAYHQALFDRQPPEGGAGLDDATLIEIGRSVGLGDAFADAVTKGTYRPWAAKATETASARNINGTPSVLVGGKKLDNPTPENLTAAVTAAVTAG
jgi:protein-disulfide isomerase